MPEEFHARLVKFAESVKAILPHVTSEAATRQYLVLPFLQILGYNPMDPNEIQPEVEASFSDKFKNKVDYAILKDGRPVIAIETKTAGAICEAQRGELRGYFNAVPTVKLGILTDGLVYELFTDTGRENMMDDLPFARVELLHLTDEKTDESSIDALSGLRKAVFDPAGVGADAKRKINTSLILTALESIFASPTEAFVRFLMDVAGIEGKRTARLVQENTPVVSDAIQCFQDHLILDRVGFASRDDLVRKDSIPESVTEAPVSQDADNRSAIETTEMEMAVYEFTLRRLAYLIKDEALFSKLSDIQWADRKTTFCVYYRQEKKGRLFNYRPGNTAKHRVEFAVGGEVIECDDLTEMDNSLAAAFLARVEEIG